MSTTRFTIHKDAHEYLTKEPTLNPNLAICSKDQFGVEYTGDSEFKKYFRGDFKKVEDYSKYYEKPELFLQNVHWAAIFENTEKILGDVLTKTVKTAGEDASLVIVNADPIEMITMGEILKSLGYANVVYNFNRNPLPNSSSKTLEGYLLLGAWKNSPYFQEQAKKIQTSIQSLALKIQGEKTFFLFDENNATASYEHAKIDDYLKTQIGYKEPKNVYRLDKYPDSTFLLGKGIKQVIMFDNDNDFGGGLESYEKILETANSGITVSKLSYDEKEIVSPGLFEDYLVLKNKEYSTYRQSIEEKTLGNFPGLAEKKKWAESSGYIVPEVQKNKKKNTPGLSTEAPKDRSLVPYLLLFPIIFLAFLASDTIGSSSTTGSGSTNTGTTTHRSGNSFFYWGGSNGGSSWTSGGGGSSINKSTSTSSSIIKSFGGGGFSKGGGG